MGLPRDPHGAGAGGGGGGGGALASYELVASAFAGRKVVLGDAGDGPAYTDGQRIFLPHGVPVLETIVGQAVLLWGGSLDRRIVARLAGHRPLRRRYLTLEVCRALDLLGPAVPPAVAARAAELYDGPLTGSPEASLVAAAARDVPEAPEWLGTIRPLKLRGLVIDGVAPTAADRERAASHVPAPQPPDEEDEADTERSRLLELVSSPLGSGNRLARRLLGLSGAGRTRARGSGGGEELSIGGEGVGPVGGAGRAAASTRPGLGVAAPAPVSGARYPEWDHRSARYRPAHCSVTEFDPLPAADEVVLPAPDLHLRRELARLGLSVERHRRQPDGETIDVTALVEAMQARAEGRPGEPHIYEQRRRTAHDLGVLILLDASGSTREGASDAKVFDAQRRVVAQLAGALDELGDRVAAFAFHSQGREDVRFLRIKDFDDRYDGAAQRRLRGVVPTGFTRLGAAVRHATEVLVARAGTTNLLLAIVGDGLPYEDGYEKAYAHEDSRKALSEAVARGVGCACVCVRSSTDEAVIERVWGHVEHRRLEQPEDLARHVRPLYRAALKAAAASRRRIGTDHDTRSSS